MTRCDHPECIAPSVGYADRRLQGPFFCNAHEQWAIDLASKTWDEIEKAMQESQESERTHYDLHSIKDS